MRSYSETHVFTPEELDLLQRAMYLVAAIPDVPGLRCHEVARAVGKVLGLQVQDGHYGLVEHSWLWTRPWTWGKYPPSVIDVYSVGSLPQVRLVDVSCIGLPHLRHDDDPRDGCSLKNTGYRPGEPRDDVDEEAVKFLLRALAVPSKP